MASILADVDLGKQFYVHEGLIIKNLRELHDAIGKMDTKTFNHHVNSERNDFKNWVEHVILDQKLSDQLAGLKTKKEMAEAIKGRIWEVSITPKQVVNEKVLAKNEPIKKQVSAKKVPVRKPVLAKKELVKKEVLAKKEPVETKLIIASPKRTFVTGFKDVMDKPHDKPFTVGGTLIALAALTIVVGGLHLSEAVVTGAATAQVKGEATNLLAVIIAIGATILSVFLIRKAKK
ncbi:MAG: hypothetical protein ABIC04_04500 [Nanoarchaeota archaeon]